jgi:GGDEF domain-containing protein
MLSYMLAVAELPFGVLLLDAHGTVLDANAQAAGIELNLPRAWCNTTVPVRVGQAWHWADLYPARDELTLVVLRPVDGNVLRAKGLLDPDTGLPGRELLIDRLGQALARARTHGTLVSLVLVRGDAKLAVQLRQRMREDHTVARYGAGTVAIVAEHPSGTGAAIAEQVTGRAGWCTSTGDKAVHEMFFEAEKTLS